MKLFLLVLGIGFSINSWAGDYNTVCYDYESNEVREYYEVTKTLLADVEECFIIDPSHRIFRCESLSTGKVYKRSVRSSGKNLIYRKVKAGMAYNIIEFDNTLDPAVLKPCK